MLYHWATRTIWILYSRSTQIHQRTYQPILKQGKGKEEWNDDYGSIQIVISLFESCGWSSACWGRASLFPLAFSAFLIGSRSRSCQTCLGSQAGGLWKASRPNYLSDLRLLLKTYQVIYHKRCTSAAFWSARHLSRSIRPRKSQGWSTWSSTKEREALFWPQACRFWDKSFRWSGRCGRPLSWRTCRSLSD